MSDPAIAAVERLAKLLERLAKLLDRAHALAEPGPEADAYLRARELAGWLLSQLEGESREGHGLPDSSDT